MSSSSWFLVQLTFEVASRFYDQLFAHNSSDWQNLTCARLKPDTRTADFPEWDISHGTCRTEWDARGLTCVCKQPGTYALLWSKKGEEVSERGRKTVRSLSSIKREKGIVYILEFCLQCLSKDGFSVRLEIAKMCHCAAAAFFLL